MISYELAKKLKEAGFPQDPDTMMGHYHHECYLPSLEELIEACGSKLHALIRDSIAPWNAEELMDDDGPVNYFSGSTPDEAVANLWLALHDKNQRN